MVPSATFHVLVTIRWRGSTSSSSGRGGRLGMTTTCTSHVEIAGKLSNSC